MTNLERTVRILVFNGHVTHIVTVYYSSKPESTVANSFQNRIGDDEHKIEWSITHTRSFGRHDG